MALRCEVEVGAIQVSIIRVGVGLALAAAGIMVELGLDRVVGLAPWLVVSFAAGLAAAVLGGPIGGLVAALVGFAGQVSAIPTWIPASRDLEGGGWVLEAITAAVALVGGIVIRRLIMTGGIADAARPVLAHAPAAVAGRRARPKDDRRGDAGSAPPVAAEPHAGDPSPSPAGLESVTAALRDFGAVRTSIQVGDALARHASALSGAERATVYLVTPDGAGLVPIGRSGDPDPSAPDRLALDDVERAVPLGVVVEGRAGDRTLIVPITVQTAGRAQTIGAVRLSTRGQELRGGPLLRAVVQLAGDAVERARLDVARRSAEGDAAAAASRLAIIGRLALELVGGRTIEEVATTLLDFAVDDLGAGFAAVHVVDEPAGGYRLAGSRGYPAGVIATQRTIAADAGSPVTQAAATHERVDIDGEDGWRAAFPRASNIPAITGVRGMTAIPMVAGGAVHGVLTIGWRTVGDRSAAEGGMLAGAAAQGAQALERAILHAHDEEARRFQEAFIGVVSHELRTPITTILGGSRLLARRLEGNPTMADLSQDIEVEADRLARIVDDLLVLSRLERRHLTIGDDPVHLDHLLSRVVRSESARWPGHTFELPTTPNRHVVLGEETYVEQVLRNLISNAAKYSPAGSTIRITIDDTPGGDIEVRVLDQGPGIAPGEVEDLFTLFYRSPTTAAAAAGAGIGLFVSRQLVAEMGGRVWAAPRPEGGSEFGFSLSPYPIDEPEILDDEPPPSPAVFDAAGAEAR